VISTRLAIDARIIRIRSAKTPAELDEAMGGFRDEVLVSHPDLLGKYSFNVALHSRRYAWSLSEMRRAVTHTRKYLDVIAVLECASDKQFELSELEAAANDVRAVPGRSTHPIALGGSHVVTQTGRTGFYQRMAAIKPAPGLESTTDLGKSARSYLPFETDCAR
jgi:hypothetical protein